MMGDNLICKKCGKKRIAPHHHYYCNSCWNKVHGVKTRKKNPKGGKNKSDKGHIL